VISFASESVEIIEHTTRRPSRSESCSITASSTLASGFKFCVCGDLPYYRRYGGIV
jgi:hypothetical protein